MFLDWLLPLKEINIAFLYQLARFEKPWALLLVEFLS